MWWDSKEMQLESQPKGIMISRIGFHHNSIYGYKQKSDAFSYNE
jgi:hypothetical protein